MAKNIKIEVRIIGKGRFYFLFLMRLKSTIKLAIKRFQKMKMWNPGIV